MSPTETPEKSIKIKTKKNTSKAKLEAKPSYKYVERRCKIVESLIVDANNSAMQTIFLVLNDIYDRNVQLKMNIDSKDFSQLGFSISSMDLIEIAAWLRNDNSIMILNVPEDARTISLQMLMDSLENNNESEVIEEENDEDSITEEIISLTQDPEPIKEEKQTFTKTVKVSKFGRSK